MFLILFLFVLFSRCCLVALPFLQDVRGLTQDTAIGSYDFALFYLQSLERLKDSTTFPIPRKVKFDMISLTYDYVTRVIFMASVYGGENVLPLVGDNFAALIYNYEFQGLLKRAYPAAYINQYGALRLQLGGRPTSAPMSSPTSQPSRQPTLQVTVT